MREVEELVFHGIAERGFDLQFLQTRGISIHAHGESQGFVVHELMRTRCAEHHLPEVVEVS